MTRNPLHSPLMEPCCPDPPTMPLASGATVAVVGGGPAGSLFAIQLLRRMRELNRQLKVLIIERRYQLPDCGSVGSDCWKGCNHCAGGISPRLVDSLRELGLSLPPKVIQKRIHSVTIQGYWKNITIEVPPNREMYSVYRGSRPSRRDEPEQNLDGFLLQAAQTAGAALIGGEVIGVLQSKDGRHVITYRKNQVVANVEADMLVFAAGVNSVPGMAAEDNPIFRIVRQLLPGFEPPRLRRALIFELESDPSQRSSFSEELHFVEYGSRSLPLEMCSLVPKRGFLTVVLVGRSADAAETPSRIRQIMRQFLALPHIRKLVSPRARLHLACTCTPNMVVGTARHYTGSRVAAVGDMVTARLYKDGLLSAQRTAAGLAAAVARGVDATSLRCCYGPVVEQFRRDNRYAAVVFLLHRLVFSSSGLSRCLYQAVLTERKNRPAAERFLESILWQIASGDDPYEQVLRAMIRPSALLSILWGGIAVTLRNWVAELFLGLRWAGLGRFTTGVALERLQAKRAAFARLLAAFGIPVPPRCEFERMYTIKIRVPCREVFAELGRFGESDRRFLHPRWLRIRRVAGRPNHPGCTVEYRVVAQSLSFRLTLEQMIQNRLILYRVADGFARGGVLLFELESTGVDTCDLSIYVAFNFRRGRNAMTSTAWGLLRAVFPAFVHDVIWNHSLCQLKDILEERHHAGAVVVQEQAPTGAAGEYPRFAATGLKGSRRSDSKAG